MILAEHSRPAEKQNPERSRYVLVRIGTGSLCATAGPQSGWRSLGPLRRPARGRDAPQQSPMYLPGRWPIVRALYGYGACGRLCDTDSGPIGGIRVPLPADAHNDECLARRSPRPLARCTSTASPRSTECGYTEIAERTSPQALAPWGNTPMADTHPRGRRSRHRSVAAHRPDRSSQQTFATETPVRPPWRTACRIRPARKHARGYRIQPRQELQLGAWIRHRPRS